MAWTYVQRSGVLLHGGSYVCMTGTSGIGVGQNNLCRQAHRNGPVPLGEYTITGLMALEPHEATQTFGRRPFSLSDVVEYNAITLPSDVLDRIDRSPDRVLQVTYG